MIDKDAIERHIDYLKYNDGLFHEVYVALMICDVMNVPLDWVDKEKLNKISDIIQEALESDGILREDFRDKIMDVEKEIEHEKLPQYSQEEEIEK